MTRWEYLILDIAGSDGGYFVTKVNGQDASSREGFLKIRNHPSLRDHLNDLGSEGWEIAVQLSGDQRFGHCLILKRPKTGP
jgi:hypothetical protein